MKIQNIPQHNLAAAMAILSPYCPEISPTALVKALRTYEPTQNRPDRLLNKHEAAAMLGVTWFTLTKWAREGKIPAHKVGSRWKFRLSEITGAEVVDDE